MLISFGVIVVIVVEIIMMKIMVDITFIIKITIVIIRMSSYTFPRQRFVFRPN